MAITLGYDAAAEMLISAGQPLETGIQFGPWGFSYVEALTDAGTGNLLAVFGTGSGRSF